MLAREHVGQAGQFLMALRKLHHKVELSSTEQSVTEVEIPMPWGKIAGKWWGSTDKQPILALHGWQDNAGSFDLLAPMLPKNSSLLAIDLPGHGFSDRLPRGVPYTLTNSFIVIRTIVHHYGWDNVKLLGHSLGSIFSFLYACYFPKDTKFVVSIDALKPASIDVDASCERISKSITKMMEIETRLTEPPRYTKQEVIYRWMKATEDSLDEATCKILMTRGVTRTSDGKYFFNRDPRLRTGSVDTGFIHEHIKKLAERVVCPYLVLKAKDSSYFEKKENFYDTIEILMKSSMECQLHMVPGKHHMHMTDPTTASNVINPFLEKYNI